jgi:hypothetical protein
MPTILLHISAYCKISAFYSYFLCLIEESNKENQDKKILPTAQAGACQFFVRPPRRRNNRSSIKQ